MNDGHKLISEAAAKLVAEVPADTVEIVASVIERSEENPLSAKTQIAQSVAHHSYRHFASQFIDQWGAATPPVSASAAALALRTATLMERSHRESQTVELVWTGPDPDAVPFRRTEQAVLQVLDSAKHRITLVSYAVYRIPHISDALVRAAKRGVQINVVVETPDKLQGENEYSTLKALGENVAGSSAVYYWPQENRQTAENNHMGILHVKCAVADGRWLFLSSANLTEYAFTINMELGVLITGGKLPVQIEQHFDRLIAKKVLERV